MRVPEISLGYGLLAQNKHDLCRYYKYTERHKQTQYLPAYTVSFMVVPSVRAWEFSEKVVGVFAFEAIRSIVKFAPDGTGYRTKIIFAKEKLLIDRMSDILLRFFNID